jgi:hypothetical protein
LGEELGARIPAVVTGVRTAAVQAAAESRLSPPSTTTDTPAASEEERASIWPDEAAESAFLAEARDRGEAMAPPKPKEEAADDSEGKPLPPLDELVQRIPAEVRDTLEDLFRARFVTVKRVPKRALKT